MNDRALLREALNEYNNWFFDWENNRKVQFDDPVLKGNETSLFLAHRAAMCGQYKIDWSNLMMAESGMQLAANMMTNANFNAQSLINSANANAKSSWLEADINPESWVGSSGGTGSKISNDKLLNAGDQLDRGGELTRAGRGLEKHGSRPGSPYPQATGNVANKNDIGNQTLKSILSNPDATSVIRHHAMYGDILEIKIPGGMGARFSADGNTFFGFLDP